MLYQAVELCLGLRIFGFTVVHGSPDVEHRDDSRGLQKLQPDLVELPQFSPLLLQTKKNPQIKHRDETRGLQKLQLDPVQLPQFSPLLFQTAIDSGLVGCRKVFFHHHIRPVVRRTSVPPHNLPQQLQIQVPEKEGYGKSNTDRKTNHRLISRWCCKILCANYVYCG